MDMCGWVERKAHRADLHQPLDTINHCHRRAIIRYFESQAENSAVLEDLVTYIEKQSTDKDRQDIRIGLYHIHLPKLEAEGILRYDSDDNTIRYNGSERYRSLLNELLEDIYPSR